MNKRVLLILFVLFAAFSSRMAAQSGAVKKVANAVLSITTFKADGSILATANGICISNDGTCVSPWSPFAGADHAVAIDAKGQKHQVTKLMGANEIYNLVKFAISGAPAGVATLASATANSGSAGWIVPYAKDGAPQKNSVKSAEKFMNKYNYYVLASQADDKYNGCPLVADNGQVLGVYLYSASTPSATDARYANDFTLSGLSINDPVLRQCKIRVALPSNLKDAQLALLMSQQQDPNNYEATVKDFISMFPQQNDGYWGLANLQASKGDYLGADNTMKEAISKVSDKGESHYNYSRLISQYAQAKVDSLYAPWTFDKALTEIKEAQKADNNLAYKQQEGIIKYGQGNYQEAYDIFMGLTHSKLRGGEVFYQAMQAKQKLGGTDQELLALLDSAVAACDTPYTVVAAPYFLARGLQYGKMNKYREAVIDLYRYEVLNPSGCTAAFYFNREQLEVKGRMWQQALNDIAHVCLITKDEPLYWAEFASVNLQVHKYADAIGAAKRAIELSKDYADAYLLLGVAQVENNERAEGMQNIAKAKELGNQQADSFLKKYQQKK
ncbi:MAG: serine protease [Prevotella sp.]|nr:serine protease [Prevotella sp.]